MKCLITLLCLVVSFISFCSCGKGVISGGDIASDNIQLYQTFIDLATVNGQHKIGVVTSGISFSIAESIAKQIRTRLVKYGAVAANVEWIPWHKDNPNSCTDPMLAAKVSQYTGIFFNGGTVSYFEDCFVQNGVDVPALVNMRTRYTANQLAILGSSAAALIMQSPLIPRTRESYTSLKSGALYTAYEGFHVFDYGFIDVHFNSDGRQGRLIRLVEQLHQYGHIGFGIAENTAMIVRDTEFEVLGEFGVYIFNLDASVNESGKRFKIRNVKATYLNNGDKYNFLTEQVTFASTKSIITSSVQNNGPALTTTDIFGEGVFNAISTSLLLSQVSTSSYGLTAETSPQFRVDFTKTPQTVGYVGSPVSTNTVAFKDLSIDIYCSANC